MADSFVTIPPDSTGKNVGTTQRTHIDFDTQVNPIAIGDTITGVTSLSTGVITAIETEGFATNEGRLYLKPVFVATTIGSFVNNENIQISAVTVADVNFTTVAQNTTHHQHTVLIDPDNPTFKQKIDATGATVNTFTEGSPQFDAFGRLRVSDATTISEYKHDVSDQSGNHLLELATGGTGTHNFNESAFILAVTNSSGSQAKRTTHRYHNYFPGYGTLIEMTASCGDSGKTGNTRRWGIFDDNDGTFFQLSGTTLSIGLRSSTTGSPVDTIVDQSAWNRDKLDSTGTSGMTIDITKIQLWWIDMQWLGAGRVRFGVFNETGERVETHEIQNSNVNNTAWSHTATLPIRHENFNTAGTSGSSELRQQCTSVKIEGIIEPFFSNQSGAAREEIVLDSTAVTVAVVAAGGTGYSVNDTLTASGGTFTTAATFNVDAVSGDVVTAVSIVNEGTYTVEPGNPVSTTGGGSGCTLTLTFAKTFKPVTASRSSAIVGGNVNRRHIMPLTYNVLVVNGPAYVQVVEDTTLLGATWASSTGSTDFDIAANAYTGGKVVWSGMLETGTHELSLEKVYDITSGTLRIDADGVSRQNVILAARGIGSSDPTVSAVFNWQELS